MTARTTSLVLLLGSAGCVVVLHVLRRDLDPVQSRLSEYAVGDHAWLMTAIFVAMGLALLALFRHLDEQVGAAGVGRLVPLLVAVAGVGLLLSAAFPTGTDSPAVEAVHSQASATSVVTLTAAAVLGSFVRGTWPTGEVARRRLVAGRAVTVVAVITVGVSPILHDTAWAGIGQRFVWLSLGSWVLLAAWSVGGAGGVVEAGRETPDG